MSYELKGNSEKLLGRKKIFSCCNAFLLSVLNFRIMNTS